MKRKRSVILGSALLVIGLLGASRADAAPIWTCAIVHALACEDDGTVAPPDLGGLARPTFLRVDAGEKRITILAPAERAGEVTNIDAAIEGEGIWVFSGVEAERAWSLVISEGGHMTLAVTVDGATWSVFGHAMQE